MSKGLLFFALLITCCVFGESPFFIGIAGGTGSGKTTFAQKIHQHFPHSVLISQDSYYKDLSHLTPEARKSVNFDHPNALEFSLLQQHLMHLKNGNPIQIPIYDFSQHIRSSQTEQIAPADIVIVEGILLFAVPEIRELLDLKIFIDTDSDERVLRRIERDMQERGRELHEIKAQYLKTVKPMHDAFVEPSKKFADIIIPEGGHNEMALSLILALSKQLEASR